MNTITKLMSLTIFAIFGLSQLGVIAYADESATTTMKNAGEDMKAETKKAGRKVKKAARHATGNHSKVEDAKDSMKDAGDDMKAGAKKAKNKITD